MFITKDDWEDFLNKTRLKKLSSFFKPKNILPQQNTKNSNKVDDIKFKCLKSNHSFYNQGMICIVPQGNGTYLKQELVRNKCKKCGYLSKWSTIYPSNYKYLKEEEIPTFMVKKLKSGNVFIIREWNWNWKDYIKHW